MSGVLGEEGERGLVQAMSQFEAGGIVGRRPNFTLMRKQRLRTDQIMQALQKIAVFRALILKLG